jgi:hypothetical protein
MTDPWLTKLRDVARSNSLVLLRIGPDEWEKLLRARDGAREFSIALPHDQLDQVRTPTVAIVFGSNKKRETVTYFGILRTRQAVTTLETRIRISRSLRIEMSSENELCQQLPRGRYRNSFRRRLEPRTRAIALPEKLGGLTLEALATTETNRLAMQRVAALLEVPRNFINPVALQEDAIQMALKAFGIASDTQASRLALRKGSDSGLSRIWVLEDAVIEHDARHIPGFNLFKSDVTGRALFKKGDEWLEVVTANKRPLEQVFGVDLIYLNLSHQSAVMVQYKMLEPLQTEGQADWVYRPDEQISDEIKRMEKFNKDLEHPKDDYRLSSELFYLKFVRRDASLSSSSMIIPLGHYKSWVKSGDSKGPKGAVRVSYEGLSGRYMRQTSFLELIQSGYIGAYGNKTRILKPLIEAALLNNRAVVAAVQEQERRK